MNQMKTIYTEVYTSAQCYLLETTGFYHNHQSPIYEDNPEVPFSSRQPNTITVILQLPINKIIKYKWTTRAQLSSC